MEDTAIWSISNQYIKIGQLKTMIKQFFLFAILSCLGIQFAHGSPKLEKSNFALSLELSSKYMWRGVEYGNAPVAFPMLSYNYKNFNVFAMGAYAFNGSHQEVDLGVNYLYKNFRIGFSDYYYPSPVGERDKYFESNNCLTGHSVESYFIFSPQKIPLWITLSTYVYGADKRRNGSQAFSSYAEVGYTYNFNDSNALSLALGANLNKSFYTDYEKGINIVNITLKYATNFKIGSFKLPVSASYILNPSKEKTFFTFSLYFNS